MRYPLTGRRSIPLNGFILNVIIAVGPHLHEAVATRHFLMVTPQKAPRGPVL